jgi:hypothetical protein
VVRRFDPLRKGIEGRGIAEKSESYHVAFSSAAIVGGAKKNSYCSFLMIGNRREKSNYPHADWQKQKGSEPTWSAPSLCCPNKLHLVGYTNIDDP